MSRCLQILSPQLMRNEFQRGQVTLMPRQRKHGAEMIQGLLVEALALVLLRDACRSLRCQRALDEARRGDLFPEECQAFQVRGRFADTRVDCAFETSVKTARPRQHRKGGVPSAPSQNTLYSLLCEYRCFDELARTRSVDGIEKVEARLDELSLLALDHALEAPEQAGLTAFPPLPNSEGEAKEAKQVLWIQKLRVSRLNLSQPPPHSDQRNPGGAKHPRHETQGAIGPRTCTELHNIPHQHNAQFVDRARVTCTVHRNRHRCAAELSGCTCELTDTITPAAPCRIAVA